MRALVLLLAVIPCVASLSETATAQSAGTGGTRQFGATPQLVVPRTQPVAPSTSVRTGQQSYNSQSQVVPFRQRYGVYIRR